MLNERIRKHASDLNLLITEEVSQTEMFKATIPELEQFVELIIEDAIAITRMVSYRNGIDSVENRAIGLVRKHLIDFFDIQERNVNEIFDKNELFREYFKIPRKGDRTYPG